MTTFRPPRPRRRQGSYNAMLGFLLPAAIGFTALSVDTSWLRLAESQAQDVADAASHAALIQLRRTGSTSKAQQAAELILGENKVAAKTADLGSIEFGQWDRDSGAFEISGLRPNAVRVQVGRYDADPVDLHFAKIWGTDTATVQADAMAASRSLHVVLVLDLTISFKDPDFYNARAAMGAFLDTLGDSHGQEDMMGLATFNYAYGVEYTPMFQVANAGDLAAATAQWAALETVSRSTNDRYSPCDFDPDHRRAHMPRAYKKKYDDVPGTKGSEHATDHHIGLVMAQQMLTELDDPFAYRAVIMLTDGYPYAVDANGKTVREECGYVEDRWRGVEGPIPHSKADIQTKTEQVADAMWTDDDIHLWNVSFVADNAFLRNSVQGDGKYYRTSNSAELIPIFEEIANSMPLLIVE